MIRMVLLVTRIDQNIVDKHKDELIKVRLAHSIHKIHKDSRGVRQTERHNKELVMTITSLERSLRNILLLDPQLMIT